MKPALRLVTTLGLALACVAPAQGATAQSAPQAAAPPAAETPEARAVSQMVVAAELAAWGRERGDAEALRVAARMLDEVPLRSGTGGDPDVAPVLTATGLRQEAAEMEQDFTSIDEIVVTGSRIGRDEANRATGREAPAIPADRDDLDRKSVV